MTVWNGLLVVAHLVTMVLALVVLVTMRRGVATAQRQGAAAIRERLPARNWAARSLHVGALLGLAISLSGSADQRWTLPWVLTGIGAYLVAAVTLEGWVLPAERRVVAGSDELGPWACGLDLILACVVIAMVAMVVQF